MAISVERLPAERRTALAPVAAAGGCCCCCCCCLHTVGGLIGAATASPVEVDVAAPATAVIGAATAAPRYSVAREYWLATLLLALVVGPIVFWQDVQDEGAGVTLLLLAMVFPAIQLGASLVTLVINLRSRRPGREQRFRHLGRITARMFVGTLIGIAVMVPLLAML